MKILITGGAGCLGSNLIEHLLPQGNEILVIDNFATGKKEVLPELSNLKVTEGNISDSELVEDCFKSFRPTLVIHSAAAYKDPLNWYEDVSTNIIGTINIAKASLNYKVEKLINFQTALCYGRPSVLPIPITHALKPFTSYGISKTAGEAYLVNSDLRVISFRLANVCGPRLAIGPIPTFYKRLKAGQKCFCTDSIRDFLDMEDFLSIVERAIKLDIPTGFYNVSTGEGHSIKDIYDTVAQYLDIDPPEVPIVPVGNDDVPKVVLDPSETEKVFNWKAQTTFTETINNQLKWYDAHGVSAIYSHLSVSHNIKNA